MYVLYVVRIWHGAWSMGQGARGVEHGARGNAHGAWSMGLGVDEHKVSGFLIK